MTEAQAVYKCAAMNAPAPVAYSLHMYQDRRDKLICALDFVEKLHHADHGFPVEYLAAIGLFRKELETTQPDGRAF